MRFWYLFGFTMLLNIALIFVWNMNIEKELAELIIADIYPSVLFANFISAMFVIDYIIDKNEKKNVNKN